MRAFLVFAQQRPSKRRAALPCYRRKLNADIGRTTPFPEPLPTMLKDEPPLPILYRDDSYIAIHKPAGLLVHRSPIDRRETRFAIQILRDQIGQRVYPAHRIDRPTSGVLVFGLDEEAGAALSVLFQERKVRKSYLAVTRGFVPESGVVDSPLHKYRDRDGMIKSEETQEALTDYRRLTSSELPYPTERYASTRYSLVQLSPSTGRRHQLRRHLAHIRHPIIGDVRHGCNKANKSARANFGINRLMLAATHLSFEHPFANRTVTIECPPEASFREALNSARLSLPEPPEGYPAPSAGTSTPISGYSVR